jgi:hypothetical protein
LPTSYATDDRIGLWYEGENAVEVVTDRPDADPQTGPGAYLVESVGGAAVETRLPVGSIR